MTKLGNPRAIGQRVAVSVFVLISLSAAIAPADDAMLYFFTSQGCAPCIQVKHVINQLDSEGYPVTTINVSERPDWANAFRVTHTPTLALVRNNDCLLYTSPSPRDQRGSRMPSSA